MRSAERQMSEKPNPRDGQRVQRNYYRITRIYKMISHSNSSRYNSRRYRYSGKSNNCSGNINLLFHYRHIIIGKSCFPLLFCWLVVTFVGDDEDDDSDYDVYLFCPLTIWAATTATTAADTAAHQPYTARKPGHNKLKTTFHVVHLSWFLKPFPNIFPT